MVMETAVISSSSFSLFVATSCMFASSLALSLGFGCGIITGGGWTGAGCCMLSMKVGI
jgi:hypothetical protein